MHLPTINDLQPLSESQRDEITILSREPAAPPAPKKRKRNLPGIPQEDEMARFFKVIPSTRDRAIFRLMYHAGLRASEIGMLEVRDWSPRTDRIMVNRLKGSNSGEHHLSREEGRALRAWLKERGMAPGAIFASKKGGPISRQRLDALVKHYAALAAWPAKLRHCHAFKHACCTHLLSKGFNIEQVQDWVGHANIRFPLTKNAPKAVLFKRHLAAFGSGCKSSRDVQVEHRSPRRLAARSKQQDSS